MEKEEIIEFLRQHSSISVSLGTTYDEETITCKVSLKIDGEEIASSSDSVDISRGRSRIFSRPQCSIFGHSQSLSPSSRLFR